jgi:hypothetical protein
VTDASGRPVDLEALDAEMRVAEDSLTAEDDLSED